MSAHDVARLVAFVAVTMMLGLVVVVLTDGDDEAFAHRDFYPLWSAGGRVLAGEAPYVRSTQPFVHPPLAIPLVAALALLPLGASFVVAGVLGAIALAVSLALIGRATRATSDERVTLLAVGSTAPSFFYSLFLGQLSGLYLLCTVGCFAGLALGAEVGAGVAAGLLAIKPPLALPLAFAVLASRSRRALLALVVTVVALFALSAPFGIDAWPTWMADARWWADTLEGAPATWWRQWTLYSFVRSSLAELDVAQGAARWTSLAITLPLGAATAWVGAHAMQRDASLRMRAASVLTLATVALNAYLFYYDALLLVVPASVAYAQRASYEPNARRAIALLVILSWALQLLTPLFAQGSVPLPGLVATLWLLVELADLSRALRAPRPASPSIET